MKKEKLYIDNTFTDKVKGGIVGGAIGDALGYPLEFLSWPEIQNDYGKDGIQEYAIDFDTGSAVFSDDTQMSLFTANGILIGELDRHVNKHRNPIPYYVHIAYKEWLMTQERVAADSYEKHRCWLFEIPDLHCRRAPGRTCLTALRSGSMGTMDEPINHSKGCGGVMRVAPLALYYKPESDDDLRKLDIIAAEIAAITHGHPLGFIPAAILNHIISIGMNGVRTMKDAVNNAVESVEDLFSNRVSVEYLSYMKELILKAERLAATAGTDEDHIRSIGDGWTGDEALAISIYCCLRYSDNFSKAIIAAVNHSGDSDSTGAITGNIMGTWMGYGAIDEKWKRNLEMKGILLEMAEDLCFGQAITNWRNDVDEVWNRKYCEGHAR